MIIFINMLNRDDKKEIADNVASLKRKFPTHQDISINELETAKADGHEELHIVSHGNSSGMGDFSPQELARKIAPFIDKSYFEFKTTIKSIVLSACNTGKEEKDTEEKETESFAQTFSVELSKLINVPHTIRIEAPTGILIYYPSGELAVIADEHKALKDRVALLKTLKTIDAAHSSTPTVLRPLLAPIPFNSYHAVSLKRLYNPSITLHIEDVEDESKENEITPFVTSLSTSSVLLSLKTYYWATKIYAETQDESAESKRVLEESKDERKDEPEAGKNLTNYYARMR